eukprot:4168023-Pyramimonas_sp.AAC.1
MVHLQQLDTTVYSITSDGLGFENTTDPRRMVDTPYTLPIVDIDTHEFLCANTTMSTRPAR